MLPPMTVANPRDVLQLGRAHTTRNHRFAPCRRCGRFAIAHVITHSTNSLLIAIESCRMRIPNNFSPFHVLLCCRRCSVVDSRFTVYFIIYLRFEVNLLITHGHHTHIHILHSCVYFHLKVNGGLAHSSI